MIKARSVGGVHEVLCSRGSLTYNQDGTVSSSAKWFIFPAPLYKKYIPIIGISKHPYWADLYASAWQVLNKNGGAELTVAYTGVYPTSASSNGKAEKNLSDRVVEVDCSMSSEPIETHPLFEVWAGTPAAPVAGVFDKDGRFTGWDWSKPITEDINGATSYLVPRYQATVSYSSKYPPIIGAIGSLGGASDLPALGNGRGWMLQGVTFTTTSGGLFKVREEYASSGEGGWNPLIYY